MGIKGAELARKVHGAEPVGGFSGLGLEGLASGVIALADNAVGASPRQPMPTPEAGLSVASLVHQTRGPSSGPA